jgi:dethiobiotin synthetase
MKEIYFITATNTNIGKTKACEIFLNKFAKLDKKVGYLKVIETGVVDIPHDGSKMFDLVKRLNKEFETLKIDDIVPYMFKLPASPYVANTQNIDIDIDVIKQKINYLHKFCDILIIEGAGGLYVPIKKDYFIYNLIQDINPTETFLIVPSYLGSINDTLLNIDFLKTKKIKFSWYINLYQDKKEFETITLPFYKKHFDKISFLGRVQNSVSV